MPETLIKPVLTAEDVMADPKLQVAYLAEMGRQSFPYFCRELLGYQDMIRRKDALVPGYSHDELCEFLTEDLTPFKLILWPRHTFKSHIATIGRPLWRLTTDPNLRFLIVCDTNEKAEGFLLGMKNHLEGKIAGSLFRTVYGDWTVDPKRGVWNQQAMVVRVRTKAQVEPSVDTAGIETSKTGKHYDEIIFDDLVSEKNITTPELMQKVKDVRKKYLSVLKPGGQIIMPGTRWHYGDAYGEIVAQEEENAKQGRPKVFATCIRSAEVVVGDQTIYPFSRMGEHSLTKERLALLKSEQGSYVFSCLYLNAPTDDTTAFFKLANFAWYTPDTLPTGLYITAALDPIPPSDGAKGDDAAETCAAACPIGFNGSTAIGARVGFDTISAVPPGCPFTRSPAMNIGARVNPPSAITGTSRGITAAQNRSSAEGPSMLCTVAPGTMAPGAVAAGTGATAG